MAMCAATTPWAAEPCTLLHVPNEPLQEWLRGHPEHWHALALLVTDKLRTAFIALEDAALLPAPSDWPAGW